jgi:hypothetical protein
MAAIPAAHTATTEIAATTIKDAGMLESLLSLEGWKSAALIFTLLGWTFATLGILSGIAVYVAKTNIETLKEAPRTVTNAPALQPHNQITKPITVVTFGYGESEAYTAKIIEGLRGSGFIVRNPMRVGFRPGAPMGLTVVPNGHDASQLMKSLDQSKIPYSVGETHRVPARARQAAADSIVLEIGGK